MQNKELTRIALFAALTALLSQIIIPLPGAVPISLGTLGVMLCGGLLPPRQAFWSMAAFLLLGGVGLPVFASFGGGLGVLFGPTGGFLWGFLPASLLFLLFGLFVSFFRLLYHVVKLVDFVDIFFSHFFFGIGFE